MPDFSFQIEKAEPQRFTAAPTLAVQAPHDQHCTENDPFGRIALPDPA